LSAAGGLGGFFPPLVMALVKSTSGSYSLGFILLAAVAAGCLIVLISFDRPGAKPARGIRLGRTDPAASHK
jgi:NNP family nitrate/nitrite transporter-like MFS transporter